MFHSSIGQALILWCWAYNTFTFEAKGGKSMSFQLSGGPTWRLGSALMLLTSALGIVALAGCEGSSKNRSAAMVQALIRKKMAHPNVGCALGAN